MTIRPLQLAEAGVLLPLWAAAATPSHTDTIADIERAMANHQLACFVAEVDGVVVGSIIAAFDGWRGNIYRLVTPITAAAASPDSWCAPRTTC